MLKVFLDNNQRTLAAAAVEYLAVPGTDPFVSDFLIVNQMGVGRWLEQQLARRVGVSANLKIDLPGRFLWRTVQLMVRGTSDRSPFDPLVVRWALMDALQHMPDTRELATLRTRWQQASGAERIALATELGGLFERYMAYRRPWLDRWAKNQACAARSEDEWIQGAFNQHEPWQRWLWQEILQRMSSLAEQHPFDAFGRFLQESGAAPDETMPPDDQFDLFAQADVTADAADAVQVPAFGGMGRVVLFGLLNMPPEQLDLLVETARFTDVVWFAADPSQGFWEEHVGAVRAAKAVMSSPEDAWLYDAEPSVLGEWGREQRDFLAAIRQREGDARLVVVDEHLRTSSGPGGEGSLQTLHAAVFQLSDEPWHNYFGERFVDSLPDESLQVHSCHSLIRQLEVVHDALLGAFQDIPGLNAEDVAVFCTDIDEAAPLVEAVFNTGGLTHLPVRISGRRSDPSPQAVAFQQFLDLVRGPAHLGAVLTFMSGDVMRRVCKLDDLLLSRLADVLIEAGAQRDDLDLAAPAKHGWHKALQRIVLSGFTTAQTETPVAGLLPVGVFDSSMATVTGHLLSLLSEIGRLRAPAGSTQRHAKPGSAPHGRSVAEWATLLTGWADRWLSPYVDEGNGLMRVRDALSQLSDSTSLLTGEVQQQLVPFDAIAQALGAHLDAQAPAASAAGAITVAPLGSLRQVPYRVVALVGMDQGKWPGARSQAEFDLVRSEPRFGDPSPVQQARGIFLDVVLGTSDRLIVTYTGRDDRNNQVSNPARIVVELCDYLATQRQRHSSRHANQHDTEVETQAVPAADDNAGATWQLGWPLLQHPLQPFSRRRFNNAFLRSFAQPWFDAANRLPLPGDRAALVGPVCDELEANDDFFPSGGVLRVDTLCRAYLEPARFLMQERGGVSVSYFDKEAQDTEPLDSVGFERFDRANLVESAQQKLQLGIAESVVHAWLVAHPMLPDGSVGVQQADVMMLEADRLRRAHQVVLDHFGSPEILQPAQQPTRTAVRLPNGSSILLTGRSDLLYQMPDGSLLQVLPATRTASVRAAIECWHQHWLLCASDWGNQQPVITVRAVDEKPAAMQSPWMALHTGLDGLAQAKDHLLAAVQTYLDICQRPYLLFPRTVSVWLARAATLDPAADNYVARKNASQEFVGEGQWKTGESKRPWPLALWRDAPPRFDDVLRDGLQVYGPIWMQVTGLGTPEGTPTRAKPANPTLVDPLDDDGGLDQHITGV